MLKMSLNSIKKVVIAGGTGLTRAAIAEQLAIAGFEVSILSRASSTAEGRANNLSGFELSTPKSEVNGAEKAQRLPTIKTDYSKDSLVTALAGHDAVVSCIQHFHLALQFDIIDAAVEAGVRHFIPSEYGCDTGNPGIEKNVPETEIKRNIIQHLNLKQSSGLSWTAVVVGGYLDSLFDLPGVFGVDLVSKTLTIYDGGDRPFEATTMAQLGRATAAILSDEHLDKVKYEHVYVNTCTITQRAFQDFPGCDGCGIQHQTSKSGGVPSDCVGKAPLGSRQRPSLSTGLPGGPHDADTGLWRLQQLFKDTRTVERQAGVAQRGS